MRLTRDSFPVLPRDPSGLTIAYVCKDGGFLCSACANENVERIIACDDECPDDDQWNVVGAQNPTWNVICDHCYQRFRR